MDISKWINGINWNLILTALLGIYGAALTTYTIYRQRKDKRPNIKSSLSMGFMTGSYGVSDAHLFIKAANHGELPIIITSWQLILPNNKQLIYPNANGQENLPTSLNPGRSFQAWVPAKVVAESLHKYGYRNKIKIKTVYFDELDNKYIGGKYEFDINGWLKD